MSDYYDDGCGNGPDYDGYEIAESKFEVLPQCVWISDPKYGYLPGVILNYKQLFKEKDGITDKPIEELKKIFGQNLTSTADDSIENNNYTGITGEGTSDDISSSSESSTIDVGILKTSALKGGSNTGATLGGNGGLGSLDRNGGRTGGTSMRGNSNRMSLGPNTFSNSGVSRGSKTRISFGGSGSNANNDLNALAAVASLAASKMPNGPVTVQGSGGKQLIYQKSDFAEVRLVNSKNEYHKLKSRCSDPKDSMKTYDDCASLYFLHDAGILENLRLRYTEDKIYTYTSTVLLAVNPYKAVDQLYTEEKKKLYHKLPSLHSQPPHPYAVGDLAYRKLLKERVDQAILISGESGAGKTQSAKIVMGFLVENSKPKEILENKVNTEEDDSLSLDSLIMKCATPILESLGNATTIRNNNSSRFGKFNSLVFNARGDLVGGEIRTYLLESSRVAIFSAKERTYHIFYELMHGYGEVELQTKLGLNNKRKYAIMYGKPGSETINATPSRRTDACEVTNFRDFKEGLKIMRMSEDEIDRVFEVIAGIVHLFELEFDDVEGSFGQGVKVVVSEHLGWAAKLLGLSEDNLSEALCKKTIIRQKKNGRDNSIFKKDRNKEDAEGAKQALVKMLYKRLFDHIVSRINDSLLVAGQTHAEGCLAPVNGAVNASFGPVPAPTNSFHIQPTGSTFYNNTYSSRRQIGILDIYGFEQLKLNSFEQLCINLANERLQDFFRDKVIVAEQELYCREGLPVIDINIESAEPLLEAIGDTLRILDNHCSMKLKGVKTNEARFTEDVHAKCGDFMHRIQRGKKFAASAHLDATLSFSITHYAGEVSYDTKNWLEKNNSKLSDEAEMLIISSDHSIVQSLTQANNRDNQGDTGRRNDEDDNINGPSGPQTGTVTNTVGKKYLEDLDRLISTLSACSLHYIRTFKPNHQQKPGIFEGGIVLDQMLQSGSVDLVKIMHEGYPNRLGFDYLMERYQSQLEEFKNEQPRLFIQALMLAFNIDPEQYCMGMSKLFLKSGCLAVLDKLTEADPVTGECKGIPPEVKKKLQLYLLKKKFRRCVNAIMVCNWMPRYMRKAKIENNQLALLQCSRNYVRAYRWAEKVRIKFRNRRVESCLEKLHKSVKAAYGIKRWLRIVRENIEIRRRKREAEKNVEICFVKYIRIVRCLKVWLKTNREKIKQQAEEREKERLRQRAV